MKAAKRRGKHVGRPAKLTKHHLDYAREMLTGGKETLASVATLLNIVENGVEGVERKRAPRPEQIMSANWSAL